MSGTATPPATPPARSASGIGSMTTGTAIAIVVNQYCSWKSITVEPDFPLAVAALAAAGVHTAQVGALAVLDWLKPLPPPQPPKP